MRRKPRLRVEFLPKAQWIYLALEVGKRYRLARRIDRLAWQPNPGTVRRVGGTDNLYRLECDGVHVVYHYVDDRVTILVIRPQYSEDVVQRALGRKDADAKR